MSYKNPVKNLPFYILIFCLFSSCVEFKKLTTSYAGNCRQLNKFSVYDSISPEQESKYIFGSDSLALLKQTYELEKFIGLDDLVTIMNLLDWTHSQLPYSYGFSGDKTKTVSNPRSALTMLN